MKRAGAVALAVALPVLLWDTRFHVVPAPDGPLRGITDPPSLVLTLAAIALGMLAAFATGRRPAATTPLLLLGTAALPAVSLLTGRHPLLLVFQGWTLLLVGAAAVGWTAARALTERPPRVPHLGEPALFVLGLGFYALVSGLLPGAAGPQGDEPHYLTMTESLWRDGDLDLANQFREKQYATFFAGPLEPHASPASPPGRVYSIHAPGLAALLLPAYASFGYPAAKLSMAALAALTAALTHRLVRDASGSPGMALSAWAALTLGPPLAFFSVAIYPEVPAALATVVFLLAARSDPGPRLYLAVAFAAAALPWLHPKYLPLSALGLALTLARRGPWTSRLLSLALVALSIALLLYFFARLYGRASIDAAYGPGFASDVSLGRSPRGALGLLFDRQFGLFALAPLFLLALPGFASLARRRPGDAMRALLFSLATFLVGASFSMWWGGSCPPARFVVPALPALALLVAFAIPRRPGLFGALALVGLAFTAIAALAPRAIHNRADGESGMLRFLSPALNLDDGLPSFVVEQPAAPLLALSLLAAFALAWRYGPRGALSGAAACALLASGLRATPLLDQPAAALNLMFAWDTTNMVSLGRPLTPSAVEAALDLPLAPWTFAADELRSTRPFDLPPGRYTVDIRARVTEAARTARVVKLDLASGDLLFERRYLREDQPLQPIDLSLPAGARRLTLSGRGFQGHGVVEAVALRPLAIVPRSKRDAFSWPRLPSEDLYRVEAGGVRVTALDLVAREDEWFRLDAASRFVVESAPATTVRITIERPRPGPADRLLWAGRALALDAGPRTELTTRALGLSLGDAVWTPVRLEAQGSRITFSGSRGDTSAIDSSDASPASLPSATRTSPPPDSAKK